MGAAHTVLKHKVRAVARVGQKSVCLDHSCAEDLTLRCYVRCLSWLLLGEQPAVTSKICKLKRRASSRFRGKIQSQGGKPAPPILICLSLASTSLCRNREHTSVAKRTSISFLESMFLQTVQAAANLSQGQSI